MVKTSVRMIFKVLPNYFSDYSLGMNKLDVAFRHLVRLSVEGDFYDFFENLSRIEILRARLRRLVR